MKVIQAILPAVLFVLTGFSLSAQETEGDLTYLFQVQDVNDPTLAKPLQVERLGLTGVSACRYMDDCQCFKLSTSQPMDRTTLEQVLADVGYQLVGPVGVSNGEVWLPPALEQWPR